MESIEKGNRRHLINEFTNLFKAEDLKRSESLGDFIDGCITREENCVLEVIPSEDEISSVMRSMHPTKAPGLDGIPAVFFQKYWNIVGGDVTRMVQNIFHSGLLLKDINRSFIV